MYRIMCVDIPRTLQSEIYVKHVYRT